MHPEAYEFIRRHAQGLGSVSTVEYGSRNVNGSIRSLFGPRFVGVDLAPGPEVDVVADARTWQPSQPVDLIVCCEVAEHCQHPELLVANAAACLKPDGLFLFTAACPPRAPHSGLDGGPVRDEYYRNVDPGELACWLAEHFASHVIEVHDRGDVYAEGRKYG